MLEHYDLLKKYGVELPKYDWEMPDIKTITKFVVAQGT